MRSVSIVRCEAITSRWGQWGGAAMTELMRLVLEEEISSQALAPLLVKHAPEASPYCVAELAALLEPFLRSMPQALSVAVQMTKSRGMAAAWLLALGRRSSMSLMKTTCCRSETSE